jgi:hypothetical protein
LTLLSPPVACLCFDSCSFCATCCERRYNFVSLDMMEHICGCIVVGNIAFKDLS